MTFTATFILIFLLAFVVIGGLVAFLSKTIDHGEARFGPDGKVISDPAPKPTENVRPAQRMDQNSDKASDDD